GFYRPYYYPYRFYRPGISFGFYGAFGYPYYGYYPYGWGYPYYYPYGYGYGYPGYSYAYPPSADGAGWGGVRIQDAPRDAQVYVDGYYVGIVDDFDGPTQHLTLEAGVHRIEIRIAGQTPRSYDVNVTVGQTMSLHVR
ncbi:MAG TPA: PEGA domain-containing protein, partial [Vicinamibacterales bacterium]